MFRVADLLAVPETAEKVGNLKIVKDSYTTNKGDTKFSVRVWSGKAKRPYANFYFNTEAARDAYIQKQIENDAANTEYKNESKIRAAKEKEQALQLFQVGTLLHYSWGYDQTNCDFFQVVERKGATVVIAPIQGETVKGSEGFMSCKMSPVKDSVDMDHTMKKVITGKSLKMSHGYANICQETDKFYCSWYA